MTNIEAAKQGAEHILQTLPQEDYAGLYNLAECFLALLKECEEYRTELEFYANLDNYDKENGSIYDMKPKGFERKLYKVLDFGERAREVLEKWEKEKV